MVLRAFFSMTTESSWASMPCVDLVLAGHDGARLGQIQVRVLEQPRQEDHPQDPLGGLAEARVRVDRVRARLVVLLPQLVRCQHRQLVVVAAEHVDAGTQHRVVTLLDAGVLHAPGHPEDRVRVGVAGGHTPVGADDPVPAGVPEQVDLHLVIGRSHPISCQRRTVPGDRDRVRAHHRGGLLGGQEGQGVLLEVVPRVDRVLAGVQVRLTTAFTSPVTGPVLDHRVDRVRAPADGAAALVVGVLRALDVCLGHLACQLHVLPEGAVDPQPARLRGQVDLWPEGRGDAHGAVLGRRCLGELQHRPAGERGSQSQVRRPAGDVGTLGVVRRVLAAVDRGSEEKFTGRTASESKSGPRRTPGPG